MPWSETTPMKERLRFLKDYQLKLFGLGELCAHYGISRKTGHPVVCPAGNRRASGKWVGRFREEGLPGLADRPRRPKNCPHGMKAAVAEKLLAMRVRHPRWGARKILAVLERRQPAQEWPAASTVGDLFKRSGLIVARRRRPHPGHPGQGESRMSAPNVVWTADFKGQFKMGDGEYCFPLTVVDGYSRYLLACRGLVSTEHVGVQPVFERLFREYGLPRVIRTDNGVPFATQAMHRLSRLHIWWIKLGICPELTQPAHPEQNGRHERMHRTLKAETARPPAAQMRAQQRAFDEFRREYNEIRPHEALGQQVPAALYQPSPRPYPRHLPVPAYPSHFEVRRVSRDGGIRWRKRVLTLTHVLAEEYIGLEEVAMASGPSTLARCSWAALTNET